MLKKWDEFNKISIKKNEEFIHSSDEAYISSRMDELSDLMIDHGVDFEWTFKSNYNNITRSAGLKVRCEEIEFDLDIDTLTLTKIVDGEEENTDEISDLEHGLDIIEKFLYEYVDVSEKSTLIENFNRFQSINELNVHDIVKKSKSGKALDKIQMDKILHYINGKFGGKCKLTEDSLKGDDFSIRIAKDSFIVNKDGHKKSYYSFDKIGQMIEFIKEV